MALLSLMILSLDLFMLNGHSPQKQSHLTFKHSLALLVQCNGELVLYLSLLVFGPSVHERAAVSIVPTQAISCHIGLSVVFLLSSVFGPVSLCQICSSVMVTLDGWPARHVWVVLSQTGWCKTECRWGFMSLFPFPQDKPAPPDMSSQGQWTLDRLWLIFVLKRSVNVAPRFLDTLLCKTRPPFLFLFLKMP